MKAILQNKKIHMFGQTSIPKTIEECVFHPEIIAQLKEFSSHSLVHTIFFGHYGYGKYTLAKAYISCHLNVPMYQLSKKTFLKFDHGDNQFSFLKSNYHFEINVQNIPKSQQDVIPEIILDLANTTNIYTHTYKIIILKNAEYLSRHIQHQLRRMMETHHSSCRLIFITHTLTNIDETIQSRCIRIAVPKPSLSLIRNYIAKYFTTSLPQIEKTTDEIDALVAQHKYNLHSIGIQLLQLEIHPETIQTTDVTMYFTTLIWKLLHTKKLQIIELRKIITDVSTTCINWYDIVHQICLQLLTKHYTYVHKYSSLFETINHHLYLYEIGNKKNYQMESLFIQLYLILKTKTTPPKLQHYL